MSKDNLTPDLVISQCRTALSVAQGSMLAIIDIFPDADVARHALKHCDKAIKAIDDLRAAETDDVLGALKGLYGELAGRFASDNDMSADLRRVMIPAREAIERAERTQQSEWALMQDISVTVEVFALSLIHI